ncbi:MAG: hypothetical protein DRR16_07790 [Candidatus Parabeggiatoa sp. nov. 3]|nr:MAG: hypothetical protein DRR16_07790 [Gammaproteobacteria bacterium]
MTYMKAEKTDQYSLVFNIVTLDEEARIERCLKSIVAQNYPQDRIQIAILDGGSVDRTCEIARQYGAKIYHNEKKLPEPGLAYGYKIAQADLVVFMAADNILYDKEWVNKILRPFQENPESVWAAFSKVVNDPSDTIWSKYLNQDTDPFNAFVFGNASHPDKFAKQYPVKKQGDNYVIYQYTTIDYPLIALAQCTVLKAGIKRPESSEYDDILPLISLIEQEHDIAYVQDTGIYHYSLKGFASFKNKFNHRIYNSIQTSSYDTRAKYNSVSRKLKKYLFLPYGFSLILPFIKSIAWWMKVREQQVLLHPIACFTLCYYILFNYAKVKLWKR